MFLECFTGMYIPSGVIFNHEVWSVAIDCKLKQSFAVFYEFSQPDKQLAL